MTLLNENFTKELQRMSKLAGISQDSINESTFTNINSKKINPEQPLKENEEDLLGDIGDLLGDEESSLLSQGKAEGTLSKDLKAAMVLNNISQYDALNLSISGEYKPKTSGAKPEAEGGTQGTIFTKSPEQKLPGASRELNRLTQYGLTPNIIADLRKAGMSQVDIDAAIEADKNTRKRNVVAWGQKGGDKQTAKWQPKAKNASIISYETIEKDGKKLFRISKVGKEQLEFLQRMLSDRPLPKNGNEDIDIEQELLNPEWPYKNLVITNAEFIIRDFFNKAVIAIIANTLKRNVKSPQDSQFNIFVEKGVDHAIDKTKAKEYNQESYTNYGAWFIQIVKHKVIDQLKGITSFTLDRKELAQRLFAQTTPLVIDSKLNPEDALPGNYTVTTSTYSFKEGDSKKPYFRYVFNDPMDASGFFGAKAEGNKKSPLNYRFLRNPSEFYTSTPKEKPEDLTKTTYEPGEGSSSEQASYEGIPAMLFLKRAKNDVDKVLNQIVDTILTSESETGEQVKISRLDELNSQDPQINKNPIKYTDFNITKSGIYTVIRKEATGKKDKNQNDTFLYTILDNDGREIKLSNRYAIPVESLSDTKYRGNLRKDRKAPLEIMRLLLQYGQLVPKYSKTVYFPSSKNVGKFSKKNVGSNIVKYKTGGMAIPFKNNGERYNNLKEAPITWTWDSTGEGIGNTEDIINKLSKIALEKNIELPSNLFNNETKQPLFKTKGIPNKEELVQETRRYINGVRTALRKFFGVGNEVKSWKEITIKNKDLLNTLLQNYKHSQSIDSEPNIADLQNTQLAENHIRKVIRELMTERFKNKN